MPYKQYFRKIALLEGVSYLLLLITMIFKYGYGIPQPNYVIGMAHGVLFIAYVILLALIVFKKKLSIKESAISFIASLVPLGTFYADKRYFRKW